MTIKKPGLRVLLRVPGFLVPERFRSAKDPAGHLSVVAGFMIRFIPEDYERIIGSALVFG